MKKDFLKLTDLTKVEVLELLKKAAELKKFKAEGTTHQPLKGKSLGMVFNKNSIWRFERKIRVSYIYQR